MDDIKNSTITINKIDDNIIFESDLKYNDRNISFNMVSLLEIIENTSIMEDAKASLEFNEEDQKFIISFDNFDEVIELSTNNMLEILIDVYFNKKAVNQNEIIRKNTMSISQKRHIDCLMRNEKPDTALFFDGRIDVFKDDKLVAVGKYAGLELNNGKAKDMLVITGVVGGNEMKEYDMFTDNEEYKAVIYQGNLKITIDRVVVMSIDSILDIKHIEFDCGDYDIKAENVSEDESLKLNCNSLSCYLGVDKIIDKEDILEDLEKNNSLDTLMEFSIKNKKILPQQEKAENTMIADDFFDDLF